MSALDQEMHSQNVAAKFDLKALMCGKIPD